MIVNPSLGKLSYYRQTPIPDGESDIDNDSGNNFGVNLHSGTATRGQTVSSYICPQCGSEIDTAKSTDEQFRGNTSNQRGYQNGSNVNGSQGNSWFGRRAFTNAEFRLSPRYFKLLQDAHKSHQSLPNVEPDTLMRLPRNCLSQGTSTNSSRLYLYWGTEPEVKIFKVVHKIGDTSLGVFA